MVCLGDSRTSPQKDCHPLSTFQEPSKQREVGSWILESGQIILDTRSPAEFSKGHIPGAHVFPLFDDQERAVIGTLYKQQGQDSAVERGLELVGPKMADFVRRSRQLYQDQLDSKPLLIHCWRGGMRSGSVAWLLETAGIPVIKLQGGYKAYRQWARAELASLSSIRILGGMTGVGKTPILHAMSATGAQVLDLEGIADHLGSAFGNLDRHEQPSSEQFSNDCHAVIASMNRDRPIWVEDESRVIGTVHVPEELFQAMSKAPIWEVTRTDAERIDELCRIYGNATQSSLRAAFMRIEEKLGGARCQEAIAALDAGDLPHAAAIGLSYYDKLYQHTIRRYVRPDHHQMSGKGKTFDQIAFALHSLPNQS